jgi:DeoR/GlpR family transcriptional regulator of sugar metabolism
MLYQEREEYIMQQLQLSSSVTVSGLMEQLQVSADTIRRALRQMEQKKLLKCVRGGACLPEMISQFSNFSGREIVNITRKRQLAKKAVHYIQEGTTVALNGGTTNTVLAQELLKIPFPFTVVTNNIAVVSVLSQTNHIEVIVTGGFLNVSEKSLYGPACSKELESFHPDICFLSINAVDPKAWYTDFRFHEIDIIRTLTKRSKQRVAVMDSGKLGRISKQTVVDNSCIDFIIMDDEVSSEQKQTYLDQGITIL